MNHQIALLPAGYPFRCSICDREAEYMNSDGFFCGKCGNADEMVKIIRCGYFPSDKAEKCLSVGKCLMNC